VFTNILQIQYGYRYKGLVRSNNQNLKTHVIYEKISIGHVIEDEVRGKVFGSDFFRQTTMAQIPSAVFA